MTTENAIPIGAVNLFSGAGGLDVAGFLAGVPRWPQKEGAPYCFGAPSFSAFGSRFGSEILWN